MFSHNRITQFCRKLFPTLHAQTLPALYHVIKNYTVC